ncbi:MAG: nuclear transport factor 2 family protein [Gluconacetobacter diazotrophicus]|nr:nuclear transport factor 2 family protein [Gluconacetobacter diazotrophicus]
MPDSAQQTIWHTYQKAWSDVSPDTRRELLARSVSEDGVYTDPLAVCRGHDALQSYIEAFRQSMPGAAFKNHRFTAHHEQSHAEWTLYDAQGREVQPGNSYARFGEDGRLTQVTGFFAVPEGA